MINAREIGPGTLVSTAFESVSGPRSTLDLRAIRLPNAATAANATRRLATAVDGPGFVARHMTTVERDAILTAYAAYMDPESPGAGPGDDLRGTILYNTTEGRYQARDATGWITLGAAGAGGTLQTTYDTGNTIDIAAGRPVFLTDDEAGAIQSIRIDKTAVQGGVTVGRGIWINYDAAAAGAGNYRGYEFDGTGFGNGEAFRATMSAATDNAIHIVSGATLVDAGALTLTLGDFTMGAGNALLSLGNLTLTNGLTSLTSTSNVLNSVSIVNNTVTTWGAAEADRGIFAINSTSLTTGQAVHVRADALTTGTLVHLETSAAGGPTGRFIRCYDGANTLFNVSATDGATTIAGTAAGTAALTLTAGDLRVSAGDIVLTDGNVAITQAQTGEEALTIIANGARTVSGVTFSSSGANNAGFADFEVNHTGAVVVAGSSYEATWATTAAATGAMFLGALTGAAAHSARIFDAINSSATATSGAGYRITFSGGAHTGHGFHAAMGTNLAGNGLLIARGANVATGSAIVVTHGAASTSAGGPDFDLDGTNTAATWIGARIQSFTGAQANTGRLLEVAQRGTGAGVTGNSLFSDAGQGNSATIAITQAAAKTGAAAAGLSITPAAPGANYRAILLDGTAGTTFTGIDIIGGAVIRSTPLIDVQDSSTGTGAGIAYGIGGAGSHNIFATVVANVAYTGSIWATSFAAGGSASPAVFNIAMANANVAAVTLVHSDDRPFTSIPFEYTFSGPFSGALIPAVRYTFSGAHTQTGIDIVETSTASGPALAVRNSGAAYVGTAGLVDLDLDANAPGAALLTATSAAAARTVDLVQLSDGSQFTGSMLRGLTTGTGSQATDGVWDLDFTFGDAASVIGISLATTQANDRATRAMSVSSTVGGAAAFANNTTGIRNDITTAVTGAFNYTGTIRNFQAFYTGSSFAAGQGLTGTLIGYDINFTGHNDAAENGTVVGFQATQPASFNAATSLFAFNVQPGWDVAFRSESGGISFITAGQNIDWTAIAAGLRFSAGQNLTIDANVAVPGTDTARINNGVTGIRLAGALRPTKRIVVQAGDLGVRTGSGTSTTNIVGFPTLTNSALLTDQLICFVQLPFDFVAGNVTVRAFFTHCNEAAGTAGDGNVLVAFEFARVAVGAASDGAAAYTNFTAQADGNAGILSQTNQATVNLAAASPGDLCRLSIARDGTAGGDTSSKVLCLFSVEIAYTSFAP